MNKYFPLNLAESENAPLQLTAGLNLSEQEEGKPRRFHIVGYTGSVVQRFMGSFIIELSGIRTENRIPILEEHDSDKKIGIADSIKLEECGLVLEGFFLDTDDAKEVIKLSDQKFPWQASIGVWPEAVEEVKAGATVIVNGEELVGPLYVWRKSFVRETSFCVLGADGATEAVAMNERPKPKPEESVMKKWLKLFLRANGLENITEDSARTLLKEMGLNYEALNNLEDAPAWMSGVDAPQVNPVQAQAPQAPANQSEQPQPLQVNEQQVALAERQRINFIDEQVGMFGLSADFRKKLVDGGKGASDLNKLILAELSSQHQPLAPAGHILAGRTEGEKLHDAAVSGMLFRAGIREEKPAPGYEDFRVMRLTDLARDLLERSGVSTRGMSQAKLASQVLRPQQFGASTSDFPSIFAAITNKVLLKAYAEAPATWRPWVNIIPATDFKEIHGVSLSEAPDLELINEHGEYKTGSFSDSMESYRIARYGKNVRLTREMMVNDDLRVFTRIPQLFGNASARKVADIVYGLLLSNPRMSDNYNLFHAKHNNLEATVKGRVSAATLNAGRKGMRMQKGPNGARLDLRPRFLLTPVAQETEAEVLIRSAALPDANMSSGVHNPWAGKLEPISEPRLDDVDPDAHYLIGDPAQVDTIEVAFLDGIESPFVDEEPDFDSDGLKIKVRLEAGAGLMDHRGFQKNPGK
ncbi:Mu-like prophage major head subunit gpT family protein [Desulfovibrio sp. UCD-KL4C]|uniref:phage major capsid protein n=1 Tax=Desulfovibrio sp. UCD-KL4C TaxID=2578120 RepID=UPI0025BB7C99|nr:Mu-like prophage major head subunit gpT family protein [Desulfovibrio sp. UCD-KL4C]